MLSRLFARFGRMWRASGWIGWRTVATLALMLLCSVSAAQAAGPGSFTQAQVDAAIASGAGYYDSIAQQPNGSWDSGSSIPVAETSMAIASYGVFDKSTFANLSAAQQTRVKNGVAYLLTQQQPDGHFDTSNQTYNTALALIALSFSGDVPTTPSGAVATAITNGRNFLLGEQKTVANGFSCQSSGPNGSGLGGQKLCNGWNYDKDSTLRSDESNTGFALTGLELTGGVPAAAASANVGWQNNIQELTATNVFATRNDGGGTYTPDPPPYWPAYFYSNANNTGSLLFGMGYDGVPGTDARVIAALKFGNDVVDEYELEKGVARQMVYHDGANEDGTCTIGGACDWHFASTSEGGYHYSMFGLTKGISQYVTPSLTDPSNFYAKIVDLLLTQQAPNGSWPPDGRDDATTLFATGFSVLALGRVGAPPPPPPPPPTPSSGGGDGGHGGNAGDGGNGGHGPNVIGNGGNGGNAGPCGGGGGGGGAIASGGGGAGGGGCFFIPFVESLSTGEVAVSAGAAEDRTTAQAQAFIDQPRPRHARGARLQLVGQTTLQGLGIGWHRLAVRFNAKTRKQLKRLRKSTVTLRLRMTGPTGPPLIVTRTVTLKR